jgi:hypothetical protein
MPHDKWYVDVGVENGMFTPSTIERGRDYTDKINEILKISHVFHPSNSPSFQP